MLIYGAASLAEVDQDTADASVAEALAAGVNHLDVAPTTATPSCAWAR